MLTALCSCCCCHVRVYAAAQDGAERSAEVDCVGAVSHTGGRRNVKRLSLPPSPCVGWAFRSLIVLFLCHSNRFARELPAVCCELGCQAHCVYSITDRVVSSPAKAASARAHPKAVHVIQTVEKQKTNKNKENTRLLVHDVWPASLTPPVLVLPVRCPRRSSFSTLRPSRSIRIRCFDRTTNSHYAVVQTDGLLLRGTTTLPARSHPPPPLALCLWTDQLACRTAVRGGLRTRSAQEWRRLSLSLPSSTAPAHTHSLAHARNRRHSSLTGRVCARGVCLVALIFTGVQLLLLVRSPTLRLPAAHRISD
jgi:hypothetical protein